MQTKVEALYRVIPVSRVNFEKISRENRIWTR